MKTLNPNGWMREHRITQEPQKPRRALRHLAVLVITVAMVMLAGTAAAQQDAKPTPAYTIDQPAPQVNLAQAGLLLEKAGKQRKAATWSMIGGALIGVSAAVASDGDGAAATASAAMMGVGALIGIGLNLSAAGKEQRAGLILQGN